MKKLILSIIVSCVILAACVLSYLWFLDHKISQFSQTPFGQDTVRTVLVPPGSGPKTVGLILAQHHIISDADLFYAYLRREKLGPRLKAGEYEFVGPMTPGQVLQKIIAGQVKLYKFTVREGLRVDETLEILARSALKLSPTKLQTLAQTPAFVRQLGVPADSLEGYLFPDTYSFTKDATEESVLQKMVTRSLEELRHATERTPAAVSLTPLQVMTLASIIEKETGAPEERPRISCVFHNRLKLDMKLQTDPTVLYSTMLRRGAFVKNITRQDLVTDHPYNTYTRKGLPPGPIASPGAAAIVAALNPISCEDLFFVSRNDGTHIFCPTLGCHEAAVRTWQVEYFKKQR